MALPELPTELWLTILALAADIWTDEYRLSHEGITKRWISIGGFSTRSEERERDILKARRTRRSLVLVCRNWHNLATPYLYNRLTLFPDQTFSLSAATNYTSHLNIFDWNVYLATKAEIGVQIGMFLLTL